MTVKFINSNKYPEVEIVNSNKKTERKKMVSIDFPEYGEVKACIFPTDNILYLDLLHVSRNVYDFSIMLPEITYVLGYMNGSESEVIL